MHLRVSEAESWLNHPITQKIQRELTTQKIIEQDDLKKHFGNHAKLAYSLGVIDGLEKFLKLNIKELIENAENQGSGEPSTY